MTDPTTEQPDTDDVDDLDDATATSLLADPDDTSDPDPGPEGNAEAARWRRRLRETEGERDTLRGRLEAAQKREVERLAGRTLRDPSDLWAGTELADLVDADGAVDAKLVTERATALAKAKPHYARPAGPPPSRRGQLVPGTADPTTDAPKLSWSDVLSSGTQ